MIDDTETNLLRSVNQQLECCHVFFKPSITFVWVASIHENVYTFHDWMYLKSDITVYLEWSNKMKVHNGCVCQELFLILAAARVSFNGRWNYLKLDNPVC